MTYPFADADRFFTFEKIEDPMLRLYLYDEGGIPRAPSIAVDEMLRTLLFREAFVRAEDIVLRVDYPLGAFVSYKWGGKDRQAQVALIADTLKRLGWKVHFDEGLPRTVAEVATYVANSRGQPLCRLDLDGRLRCRDGRRATVSKAEWLFDEINYAMSSYNQRGQPEIIALCLEGEARSQRSFRTRRSGQQPRADTRGVGATVYL